MLEPLARCDKLLQYFASSAVTFATADNSITATGIGTAFPAGSTKKPAYITIAGPAQAGNNRTFTIVSATANKIIVSETVTAESAGASVTINGEYISDWKQAFDLSEIVGAINASQNCTAYLEFGNKKTADFTITIVVVAGVAEAIEQKVLGMYVRFRILNGGTDQTTMSAFINGSK